MKLKVSIQIGTAAVVWLAVAAFAGAGNDPRVLDDVFPRLLLEREAGVAESVERDCLAALRAAEPVLRRTVWPYALDPPRLRVSLLTSAGFERALAELGGGVPDWGVGVEVGDLILVDCERAVGIGRDAPLVMLHETAHALLHFGAGPRTEVPRWFHEGVAQRVSGEWRFRDTLSLILGGRIPSLESLSGSFPRPAAWADQAYRGSLLAVTFLERWHGDDVVARVVLQSRRKGDFTLGFIAATGSSPAAFAERFRIATNRRFGWIGIFTRWPGLFVLAALVFAVGAAIKLAARRRRIAAMPDHGGAPPQEDPGDRPEGTF